jgi:hypothetical protein
MPFGKKNGEMVAELMIQTTMIILAFLTILGFFLLWRSCCPPKPDSEWEKKMDPEYLRQMLAEKND